MRISSLNWLRVFEAAARFESFSKAAEHLNMSTAAVSQQIQALETNIGQSLFTRRPQGVRLTDQGRAFLPSVQRSLDLIESSARGLFGAVNEQTLTIQAEPILTTGWLPKQLAAFEAAHPGFRVNIAALAHMSLGNPSVSEPHVDVRLVFGSEVEFSKDARALFAEQISIVARPDIAMQCQRPADLLEHRLIEVSNHYTGWHQVLGQFDDLDIGEASISFVDSTPTALLMAQQGLGLALSRSPASDDMLAALGLEPVACNRIIQGSQQYFVQLTANKARLKIASLLADCLIDRAVEL